MGSALSLGNSVDNNDRRPDHSSDALIIRLIIRLIIHSNLTWARARGTREIRSSKLLLRVQDGGRL